MFEGKARSTNLRDEVQPRIKDHSGCAVAAEVRIDDNALLRFLSFLPKTVILILRASVRVLLTVQSFP
jgi:hypothetical protein